MLELARCGLGMAKQSLWCHVCISVVSGKKCSKTNSLGERYRFSGKSGIYLTPRRLFSRHLDTQSSLRLSPARSLARSFALLVCRSRRRLISSSRSECGGLGSPSSLAIVARRRSVSRAVDRPPPLSSAAAWSVAPSVVGRRSSSARSLTRPLDRSLSPSLT